MTAQVGLSYKGGSSRSSFTIFGRLLMNTCTEIAEALASFLEISIHTILCLRLVYPASTFTRRRAHGVPVYQSRHPQVRAYISEVVAALSPELLSGKLRRMTLVVKSTETGLPLERYISDLGYLGELEKLREGRNNEVGLIGAPSADELSLMLRGFLIKLTALDGQLLDNTGETTFAVIVETDDALEPSSNAANDGSIPPWIPALSADTLRPPSTQEDGEECPEKHEPLLSVKAVETGVIDVSSVGFISSLYRDSILGNVMIHTRERGTSIPVLVIRLMVQECVAKTGVEHLRPTPG